MIDAAVPATHKRLADTEVAYSIKRCCDEPARIKAYAVNLSTLKNVSLCEGRAFTCSAMHKARLALDTPHTELENA